MIQYTLPETVEIAGTAFTIRSDFRAILDICVAMQDPDLTEADKAYIAIKIFYRDPIPFSEEALKRALWFISCGQVENTGDKKQKKLYDWEQDFPLIISAVNKVAGYELRSIPHLHWWTFIGYFQEIGECLFSRVVAIRSKRSKGKKLDEIEKEFYRENKELVDFKAKKLKPSALLQRLVQGGGEIGG